MVRDIWRPLSVSLVSAVALLCATRICRAYSRRISSSDKYNTINRTTPSKNTHMSSVRGFRSMAHSWLLYDCVYIKHSVLFLELTASFISKYYRAYLVNFDKLTELCPLSMYVGLVAISLLTFFRFFCMRVHHLWPPICQ